jgi:hypothetical protein
MVQRLSGIGDPNHFIGLRALYSLDNIKLDNLALFEGLVAVELDRAIVHKDVITALTSQKTIAFCVVKPLHAAFVL